MAEGHDLAEPAEPVRAAPSSHHNVSHLNAAPAKKAVLVREVPVGLISYYSTAEGKHLKQRPSIISWFWCRVLPGRRGHFEDLPCGLSVWDIWEGEQQEPAKVAVHYPTSQEGKRAEENDGVVLISAGQRHFLSFSSIGATCPNKNGGKAKWYRSVAEYR